MRRVGTFFLFLASSVFACTLPVCAHAQRADKGSKTFKAPPTIYDFLADDKFFMARKPAFKVTATLIEHWVGPDVPECMVRVFACAPPELPGQKVSTRLSIVDGDPKWKAEEMTERSFGKRPMLVLDIPSQELSLEKGVSFQKVYVGTTYARTLLACQQDVVACRNRVGEKNLEDSLKRAVPRAALVRSRKHDQSYVPQLTDEERKRYLASSPFMDYDNPEFIKWMDKPELKRKEPKGAMKREGAMKFAHRVFAYFVNNGKYIGGPPNHRPSYTCIQEPGGLASDCGGLSLLFVAVMRANGVPARILFGRWAISQTDGDPQFHVTAEFFVEKCGWVPVDISGTIVHKPKSPDAYFGWTDGTLIAFHEDTDLEPDKDFRFAFAQYLLIKWPPGKFSLVPSKSSWKVQRSP